MAAEKSSVAAVGPIDSSSPAEVGGSHQAQGSRESPTGATEYFAQLRGQHFSRKCWKLVTWTPKRCRWDPEDPPKFSMGLNLLFGFVS